MILFVAYTSITNNLDKIQTTWFSLYVIALFLCVVLHEFGHALAASKFGVKTQDIILSPVGGVARLESMPEKPSHELIIALAGPFVNVIIFILTFIGLSFLGTESFLPDVEQGFYINDYKDFLKYILIMNGALFMFNLIPAFPMDGGRVLRALLAMRLGRYRATRIAAFIGRVIAIGFIVFGLYNEMMITSLIGVFIFTMAGMEANLVNMTEAFSNKTASEIYRSHFSKLHLSEPYSTPIELFSRNVESNFLVYDSLGYISGSIPSQFIIQRIREGKEDIAVGQFMSAAFSVVPIDMPLKSLFDLMNQKGFAIVAVEDKGEIVGVIDRDSFKRFLEIHQK